MVGTECKPESQTEHQNGTQGHPKDGSNSEMTRLDFRRLLCYYLWIRIILIIIIVECCCGCCGGRKCGSGGYNRGQR